MISFSINKTDEEVFQAARVAYSDFEGVIGYNYYDYLNEIEEIRLRNDLFAEWRSEVIVKYLDGRIKNDDVNVGGYAIAIEQNARLAKASRETNFVSVSDKEQDEKGITENSPLVQHHCTNNVEDWLEKFIVNDEMEAIKTEFKEFYETVAVEHGLNLETLIRKALLTGHRSNVSRIKLLMKEYGKEELIETILRNEELCFKLGLKDDANDSTMVWSADNGNDKECEIASNDVPDKCCFENRGKNMNGGISPCRLLVKTEILALRRSRKS